ncbi:C4-dicarboxylate TRAP transporter large permease protein DctM [bioreactor metagenome]|uniref:C4-dicarboxylate TRAP transporter large permease protein DctM n=1 Tax=bioreactor metagenome TaxID=1076179 RepID=A0A645EN16_9ZZZZ
MVCNLALGMITPPFGVNLFVAAQIAKIKYIEMIPWIIPYMLVILLDLMLITYIPEISLFVPGLFK